MTFEPIMQGRYALTMTMPLHHQEGAGLRWYLVGQQQAGHRAGDQSWRLLLCALACLLCKAQHT